MLKEESLNMCSPTSWYRAKRIQPMKPPVTPELIRKDTRNQWLSMSIIVVFTTEQAVFLTEKNLHYILVSSPLIPQSRTESLNYRYLGSEVLLEGTSQYGKRFLQ
jgi:hypothetical protein